MGLAGQVVVDDFDTQDFEHEAVAVEVDQVAAAHMADMLKALGLERERYLIEEIQILGVGALEAAEVLVAHFDSSIQDCWNEGRIVLGGVGN